MMYVINKVERVDEGYHIYFRLKDTDRPKDFYDFRITIEEPSVEEQYIKLADVKLSYKLKTDWLVCLVSSYTKDEESFKNTMHWKDVAMVELYRPLQAMLYYAAYYARSTRLKGRPATQQVSSVLKLVTYVESHFGKLPQVLAHYARNITTLMREDFVVLTPRTDKIITDLIKKG